jgi:hypothetical protein
MLIKKFGGETLRKVETDKAEARKTALYGLSHPQNAMSIVCGAGIGNLSV